VATAAPLLWLLALGPGAGAQTPATPPPLPTAEELFAKGVQLHQAGDILGAIEAYQDALQKEPGRVDARSNLGAAWVRLGRYEDAVREYRRALETEPGQVQVRFNLALALYKSAQIPEASKELHQVRALDPAHTAALLLLADCQLQMGNDAAVVSLLDPHEATLKGDRLFAYLLGTALLRRNELERGQRLIDRLFKDGDTAQGRLLLGLAHLRRKDGRGALVELDRAAELDPKLPGLHGVRGRAFLDSGRRADAVEAFRRELARNPNDFDSNLYLGLLLKDENNLDEAQDYLRRASRLRADDPRVLYGLGNLHLSAGRVAEAEQALKAVTVASPDYLQAHVLLAMVYYRQKKKDLGDQEKAIAERLQRERQVGEPGASDELGPVYKGEDLPPDPAAAKDGDTVKKPPAESGGGRP
jgi:tetratricopeptide (TPR) repeat protein